MERGTSAKEVGKHELLPDVSDGSAWPAARTKRASKGMRGMSAPARETDKGSYGRVGYSRLNATRKTMPAPETAGLSMKVPFPLLRQ